MSDLSERIAHLSPDKLALLMRRAGAVAPTGEPIAVVGLACRFPGASDVDEYWRLLDGGVDATGPVPADRWDVRRVYDPDPDRAGRVYARGGGFLRIPVDEFDAAFFGISPREAESMDPQHRLLLEVAWEALEHGGQAPGRLAGSSTGVFVGIGIDDYKTLQHADPEAIDAHTGTGNLFCAAAGRVSHVLGLTGPCLAVDTGCSSSLVAVHLAVRSLRSGECDMALAAGVHLMLSPEVTLFLSRARALSPDGRCRTFDAAADGYARGEGCGAVVLKRLSDATAAGDQVLAVIRGSAVNHDGPSAGLTVPNGTSQRTLIRTALRDADVRPEEVDYLEAHGTGTPLGDPIEVEAFGEVLGEGRPAGAPLLAGSVKTNIGHLEAAAGIASLIKTVLAVRHGEIPAHLHLTTPNPRIGWAALPVRVPTETTPWPRRGRTRVAGVSSFGIGGTNAHVVVSEAPSADPAPRGEPADGPALLAVSARGPAALAELARRYDGRLADPELSWPDAVHTALVGRAHFAHRLAVVADDAVQARARLGAWLAGDRHDDVVAGEAVRSGGVRVAFAFPAAAPDRAVVRALRDAEPAFRAALQECVPPDGESTADPLDDRTHPEVAAFAVQYALTRLWRSWGVRPDLVLFDGSGWYAAACAAEALRPGDAGGVLAAHAGDELAGDARTGLGEVPLRPAAVPMISMHTGERFAPDALRGSDPRTRTEDPPTRREDLLAALRAEEVDMVLDLSAAGLEPGGAGPEWSACLPPSGDPRRHLLRVAARLYVRGVDVSPAEGGRTTALPTYPFQRRRYWRDTRGAAEPVAEWPGQRLRSPAIDGTVYRNTYTAHSPRHLADHVLFDTVVVPGASHLALLAAALRSRTGHAHHEARDVTFRQALALPPSARREVQLVLRDGTFEVASTDAGDEGGTWTAHASGRWTTHRSAGAEPTAPVPVAVALGRCAGELSGRRLHELMASAGYQLGPSFQWVDHIRLGDGEAVAEVRPPTGAAGPGPHPGLLDTCFQVVMSLVPEALRGHDGEPGLHVPVRVERFAWSDAPAGVPRWLHVVADRAARDRDDVVVDLTLYGDDDAVLLAMEGARLRRVPRAALLGERTAALYRPRWRAETPETAPEAAAATTRWLVVADDPRPADRLAGLLAAAGEPCDVWSGSRFPADAEGGAQHERATTRVVVLAGARTASAVLRWAAEVEPAPAVALVTVHAHEVAAGDPVDPAATSVWGIGRVAQAELGRLSCGLADLDRTGEEELGALVRRLRSGRLDGDAAAYREGRWHRVELTELAGRGPAEPVGVRGDGSYLITGGLGALGRLVARRLVDHGARRLLLLGRREPDADAAHDLAELRSAGVRVEVVRADVTDAALRRTLAEATSGIAPLRGVVHAAGVRGDGGLVQLDAARLREVAAPKGPGAEALAEALDGVPLDFFLLFSSAAATLGTRGQGAYAAANAHLDGLAHRLRAAGVPATSVAWGPWAGVGMAGGLDQRELDRLAERGASALSTDQALRLLDRVLAEPMPPHVVALAADPARPVPPPEPVAGEILHPRPDTLGPRAAPSGEVEQRLVEIWEESFGIRPIGVDDDFYALGGDSMLVLTVVGRLRQHGWVIGEADFLAGGTIRDLAERVTAAPTPPPEGPVRR